MAIVFPAWFPLERGAANAEPLAGLRLHGGWSTALLG